MKLYRILIDTFGGARFGIKPRAGVRHDLIVLADDPGEARRVALREMRGTGKSRRVVPESLVEIVPDHPRVVMREIVTW